MNKRKLHKKRIFILLTSLAVLIGAVVRTNASKANTSPIRMDEKYPLVEIIHTTDKEKVITIDYPFFHLEEVDQAIETYLKETITPCTKNEQLMITYEIGHYSQQTVSIIFTEKRTAKNKEKTFNHRVTIDLANGKIIRLDDLFKNESDYLSLLSDIAYHELKNKEDILLSNKELAEVVAPTQDHFQEFTLLNKAIIFYLTVGDQMADTQLIISKELLKDMLEDKYISVELNKDRIEDINPPNMITELPKKDIQIAPDQKVIALTFDDGPKKGTTDSILEALRKYDAHATFFVLGSMAEKNPELLRDMVEQGNDVGSHTWDHRLMTKLSEEEMIKQINQTNSLIKEMTGKEATLFRPPYGAYDQRVTSHLGKNTDVILWDVDPEDWKYRNKDHIVQSVLNQAGDGKIILMHDIYKTSAEAAVEIMEKLTAQGYKIVSVSELQEIQKQRELAS